MGADSRTARQLDLVELARPGDGVANDAGDLILISLSKYSVKEKKFVIFLVSSFLGK